jgi:hypothetical protein
MKLVLTQQPQLLQLELGSNTLGMTLCARQRKNEKLGLLVNNN